jgi:hypothetical protein
MNPLDLISIGEKIIDKFVPDPEAKAKAKLDLRGADLKELELQMSAIVMEAKSNDKWTSRARPSLMYVFYILILTAIPMGVLFAVSPTVSANVIEGMRLFWQAIPEYIITAFTVGYLGYTGARTIDKRTLKNK